MLFPNCGPLPQISHTRAILQTPDSADFIGRLTPQVPGFLQEAGSAEGGQRSRRVRTSSPKLDCNGTRQNHAILGSVQLEIDKAKRRTLRGPTIGQVHPTSRHAPLIQLPSQAFAFRPLAHDSECSSVHVFIARSDTFDKILHSVFVFGPKQLVLLTSDPAFWISFSGAFSFRASVCFCLPC